MTRSEHPAILRFPAQADRILGFMRTDKEFAGICQDYAQIVRDIACKEHSLSQSSAVLVDLLQLRSDLECDIVDWLSDAGEDSSPLDERERSNLVAKVERP